MSTDSPARKWGVCDATNDVMECRDEADARRVAASLPDLDEEVAVVYQDPGGRWVFAVSRAEVNPLPTFGTLNEVREFEIRRTALLAAATAGAPQGASADWVLAIARFEFEPYLRGQAK